MNDYKNNHRVKHAPRRTTEHEKVDLCGKLAATSVDWRSKVTGAGDCSPSPTQSLIRKPFRGTTE
jgi:hypothetical protein